MINKMYKSGASLLFYAGLFLVGVGFLWASYDSGGLISLIWELKQHSVATIGVPVQGFAGYTIASGAVFGIFGLFLSRDEKA